MRGYGLFLAALSVPLSPSPRLAQGLAISSRDDGRSCPAPGGSTGPITRSRTLATGLTVTIDHDEGTLDLRPVDTVYAFPVGTFVENIAVRPSGEILVAILAGALIQLDPKRPNLAPVVVNNFAENVSNLVEIERDVFYVTSGRIGQRGTWSIFKVDMSKFNVDASGVIKKPAIITELVQVPAAVFLNGLTYLERGDGFILVGDSSLAVIYSVNLKTRAIAIWSQDQLLKKNIPRTGDIPAVNGLEVRRNYLYAVNSNDARFLRVGIDRYSAAAGPFEIVADNLGADDFAFDDRGNAYLTSHIFDSVIRLTPDGARSRVAGGQDNTLVAGTTSAAFGRTRADSQILYVATDGGIFAPVNGQVGPGRVLSVNLSRRRCKS